jgi:SHS family lactate transporter-like MFS transporter
MVRSPPRGAGVLPLGKIFRTLFQHMGIFSYLLVIMTAMTCMSHGTQNLYPNFSRRCRRFGIRVIYNVGAIIGVLGFGALSERISRRYAALFGTGLCLLSMPTWTFGGSVLAIVIGYYIMQTGVQGRLRRDPAQFK